MTHGKTHNKPPRRTNHKATKSKTNTGTTTLERSAEQTTGGPKALSQPANFTLGPDATLNTETHKNPVCTKAPEIQYSHHDPHFKNLWTSTPESKSQKPTNFNLGISGQLGWSKIAKMVLIWNLSWQQWPPSLQSILKLLKWTERPTDLIGSIGVTCSSKIAKIILMGNSCWHFGKLVQVSYFWLLGSLVFHMHLVWKKMLNRTIVNVK